MALDLQTLMLLIAEQESVQDIQAKNTKHMYFLTALCCWLMKRNLQQSRKTNNKMIFESDETLLQFLEQSLQESKCKWFIY